MRAPVNKTQPKLRLSPNPTFHGEVRIGGHGEAEPLVLMLEFRHMGKKDAHKWIAAMENSECPAAETLLDIVVSVRDAAGASAPATAELFDDLMDNWPRPFADIVSAWSDCLTKGREKN